MATELQALRSKLEVLSSNCSQLSAQLEEVHNVLKNMEDGNADDARYVDTLAIEPQDVRHISPLGLIEEVIHNPYLTSVQRSKLLKAMGLKPSFAAIGLKRYQVWRVCV